MRISNIALVFTAPAWGGAPALLPTLDLNFIDEFYSVYEYGENDLSLNLDFVEQKFQSE